ncbi:hypothetical protein Tco_1070261 [Tanacetum coccineum]|uniref:Reverse transcriptase domain-containing protein n=1 Tax=Tanacetum coccineum TaxID=301880 RepID=A0ABQ5HM86_9ASTR
MFAALTTKVSDLNYDVRPMLNDQAKKASRSRACKSGRADLCNLWSGLFKTDFENYVKANDAILRNMQNQGQGSLPSNTVTNPKEDLKGITTRSGVAYQGPTILTSSPQVVERRTEVTKDPVFSTNNGITEDVQPPVVLVENQNPVSQH